MPAEPEPGPTTDPWQRLREWIGSWRGVGRGEFPTIDPFEYEEELRFDVRDGEDHTLHFQQRTWRREVGGHRSPSHWESGFFLIAEDGSVEVLNAQNSGRVEVLRGGFQAGVDGGLRLVLASVVQAHDPRMVRTERCLWSTGDVLTYQVGMVTTAVPAMTPHLECRLFRVPDLGW